MYTATAVSSATSRQRTSCEIKPSHCTLLPILLDFDSIEHFRRLEGRPISLPIDQLYDTLRTGSTVLELHHAREPLQLQKSPRASAKAPPRGLLLAHRLHRGCSLLLHQLRDFLVCLHAVSCGQPACHHRDASGRLFPPLGVRTRIYLDTQRSVQDFSPTLSDYARVQIQGTVATTSGGLHCCGLVYGGALSSSYGNRYGGEC
jgi:hypothetical protein